MRIGRLESEIVRPAQPVLWVLLATVALVLLIGCSNLGSLLLVRAVEREKEMALRAALGASYPILTRQAILEVWLLATMGAALGLLLAHWSIRAFLALLPQSLYVPRVQQIALNVPVLGITALISMAAAVLFGAIPNLRLSRPNLNELLRSTGAPTRFRSLTIFRRQGTLLLIGEIGLTLALVTGSILLAASLEKLVRVNLHFEPERLLSLEVSFSNATSLTPGFDKREPILYRQFLNKLDAMPGIRSVALIDRPLLHLDDNLNQFRASGGTGKIAQDYQPAEFHVVTPSYFSMMGIELLRGRWFTDSDNSSLAKVAVINDAMWKRYWPDADPLGIGVSPLVKYNMNNSYIIVGIVHESKRFGAGQNAPPTVYVPFAQLPLPHVTVLAKVTRNPQALVSTLRSAALNILPGQMLLGTVQTGEGLASEATARARFVALLVSALSGLALLLSMVGVYGLVSYYTSQRTREIAIRVAFGAQRSNVLVLVLKQSLSLIAVGVFFGLIAACAFDHIISGFLYDVAPTDWTALAAAVLVLLLIGFVATWIPAWRATRLEPIRVLRHE